MKRFDKIIFKHGSTILGGKLCFGETQLQYLVGDADDLISPKDEGGILLISKAFSAKKFIPIYKKHNFIQINENTYELDVEPINKDDL